ncbi:UDP-N-acetylglucosamine 2-epimerase (non-hydrolyzing) [Membranicola marinus]|uniref:UDP-N-acetylglucosamine 2-epimerase (Non-hydrolyzing) n=1 Tax=Membranihabitans marinus TaxID=1227546 RepID=A0A953HS40_9BACT|nr:UDP-N-acetylglucosamine 2-epimerase (non-hydrolyzing) [Membranihabitans marinus]MBY5959918.1 UDP-N-acetylglucosamine 2-epimerase (non-hydrolyzing) [Membranihabitans marinus]
MKHKIVVVIGARPQFIKHAPLEEALKPYFEVVTVHTGQHYDENMSKVFFDELAMNKPAYNLEVGSKSHTAQTTEIMMGLEKVLEEERPDMVLLYGDTNSTLAGALVASKMKIPIGHVEAGLRSFNRAMPEEINRVVTDHVSTLLFAPTDVAVHHLAREGITKGVALCGDVMYDLLKMVQIKGLITENEDPGYYYTTIHRPYNTDDPERLLTLFRQLNTLDKEVIFSIHPRTRHLANRYQIDLTVFTNIRFIDPASYLENINYLYNANALITDSGGMQKEAYFLRKQCVTIRSETEWTETLENGWNTLCFDDLSILQEILDTTPGRYINDLYGSGNASGVIRMEISNYLNNP